MATKKKQISTYQKYKSSYNTTTRSNAKYIRLTEVLDIINKDLREDKWLSRETLLARLKRFQEETGASILKQDPSPSPEKSPIMVDWDYVRFNIPSLIESDLQQQQFLRIESLESQMHVLYEIMYLKGYLRRVN